MNTLTKTAQNAAASGVRRVPFVKPLANVRETAEGYVLQAEMPGVNKSGLEVSIENGELSILGRRSDATPSGQLVYRESRAGDYQRTFELDPTIDGEKISAKMEQGILTLTLPKTERVKPRKIAITD